MSLLRKITDKAQPLLSGITPRLRSKIVLVDVGAAGGLQPKWLRYRHSITPVLFEPNPDEAALLRNTLQPFKQAYVLETALSDAAECRSLNIAKWPGCTSMLEADTGFLSNYEIAPLYQAVRTVEVACSRYDDLVAQGKAPRPDVIKVDIEGFESRALDGFGDLLQDVLGVETEAWYYPAFKGQALLHDLVSQLQPFGLRLRRVEKVPGFDGDLVCANAYFTRSGEERRNLSADQQSKFAVVSRVWQLDDA
jgi:FkbM family methyltransferase